MEYVCNTFLISVSVLSGCEGGQCDAGRPTLSSPPSSLTSSSSSSLLKSKDFLAQFAQVNSPNGGDRKHRDASAVLPFIGLTGSEFRLFHLQM